MKYYIKTLIVAISLLTVSGTVAQINYDNNSRGSSYGEMGGPGFDDQVVDNAPIDDYVWVGLIAGVLIGATAYSLRKKQTA